MGRSLAIAVVAAALSLGAVPAAHSAGLGQLAVLSALGQPLNLEIQIVAEQAGEADGITAKLASIEAFRQAGIDFNPALMGLKFAIEHRDGKPLLKVTSSQPINEPFLDMLVELGTKNGRLVREYTFLLDPPEYKGASEIAAAPAPAPQAEPAPQPAQAPATSQVESKPLETAPAAAAPAPSAAKQYEVKKGDTLAKIARENMVSGLTLEQMLAAIYRANQDAFIRDNINLVRAGRILNIPGDATGTLDEKEAKQLVQKHAARFNEYRRRLAAVPTPAESSAGRQEASGRIEPAPAPAPAEKQDTLRLSKTEPAAAGSPASRAARADDVAAQQRALKEAQSRVADLEKNVSDLQKLLELKNQQLAQLETKPGAKPAPAPAPAAKPAAPAPAPAAKPAAPAPTPAPAPAAKAPEAPAAPAAKPAAPAPTAKKPAPAKPAAKKAPPAPVKEEPGIIDEFLGNPLALGGLGLVVVLLVGYAAWAWRRKKASQAKFEGSVLDAASGAGAASVFGAPAAAAAAAAPSEAPVSQAPAGMEAEEVDPIAEADVYMAYGRDAQAEEILKEALAKDAKRVAVHSKLLEIYANRKDAKSFEQTAVKLKSLTNGAGPEWDKATALGRSIDPQNGLYGGAPGAAAPAPAAVAPVAAAPAPTLDFDLGSAAAAAASPDITLGATSTKQATAPIDFDLGAASTPAAAAAPAAKTDFTPEGTLIMEEKAPDTTGLDFDLGLGGGETAPAAAAAPAPAAPAPAAATPVAADTSGLDFDLNLDMGTATEEKKPAAAAPAMDLSAISLDLGTPSAPAAAGGDQKWQEVATKLDLAKAYEEMGDKDGARELLNEVMKDGDAAQKGQAQQLLSKLG